MRARDRGEHSERQRPQLSLVGAPKRCSCHQAGLLPQKLRTGAVVWQCGPRYGNHRYERPTGCSHVGRSNGRKVSAVFLAGTPIAHGAEPSRLLGFASSPQPMVLMRPTVLRQSLRRIQSCLTPLIHRESGASRLQFGGSKTRPTGPASETVD
jgi:hypothetical protein